MDAEQPPQDGDDGFDHALDGQEPAFRAHIRRGWLANVGLACGLGLLVMGDLGHSSDINGPIGMPLLVRSASITPGVTDPFSHAFIIPDGSEVFRVELVCRFKGTLTLTDLGLERTVPLPFSVKP